MAAVVFLWVSAIQAQTQELIDTYMDHWKDFYPSSAFSEGQKTAAWRFEDFSKQRISDWLGFLAHRGSFGSPSPRSPMMFR